MTQQELENIAASRTFNEAIQSGSPFKVATEEAAAAAAAARANQNPAKAKTTAFLDGTVVNLKAATAAATTAAAARASQNPSAAAAAALKSIETEEIAAEARANQNLTAAATSPRVGTSSTDSVSPEKQE